MVDVLTKLRNEDFSGMTGIDYKPGSSVVTVEPGAG